MGRTGKTNLRSFQTNTHALGAKQNLQRQRQ